MKLTLFLSLFLAFSYGIPTGDASIDHFSEYEDFKPESMGSPDFIDAVASLKKLDLGLLTNDEKVQLFAVYKQSLYGNIPDDFQKPGKLEFKWDKRARWQAWKDIKGMSKIDAQGEYVEIVKKICERIGKGK